jgi:general secretion pathway protein G
MQTVPSKTKTDRNREGGFTLVEMLVVLAIIGLVTATIAPRVIQYLGRAKTDTAKNEIQNIAIAMDLFRLDVGRYPTEQEGLRALVDKPMTVASWTGPYLAKKAVPADPWGRPYVYRTPGQHGNYDLFTLGADNSPGGNGEGQDVTNW